MHVEGESALSAVASVMSGVTKIESAQLAQRLKKEREDAENMKRIVVVNTCRELDSKYVNGLQNIHSHTENSLVRYLRNFNVKYLISI